MCLFKSQLVPDIKAAHSAVVSTLLHLELLHQFANIWIPWNQEKEVVWPSGSLCRNHNLDRQMSQDFWTCTEPYAHMDKRWQLDWYMEIKEPSFDLLIFSDSKAVVKLWKILVKLWSTVSAHAPAALSFLFAFGAATTAPAASILSSPAAPTSTCLCTRLESLAGVWQGFWEPSFCRNCYLWRLCLFGWIGWQFS